jgi:hypothetical protein
LEIRGGLMHRQQILQSRHWCGETDIIPILSRYCFSESVAGPVCFPSFEVPYYGRLPLLACASGKKPTNWEGTQYPLVRLAPASVERPRILHGILLHLAEE